jgi:hypothetical protein
MTVQVITPGVLWDGTAGSGGSAPAQSDTIRGTGTFNERAIGHADIFDYDWIHATTYITVGAGILDPGRKWIEEVEIYLEGTELTITEQTKNPQTGSVGWTFGVQSPSGTNGDANLYVYIRGYEGMERRVLIPLTLNTDGAGLSRTTYYIDCVSGNDTTGDGSNGTPWATVNKALRNATTGSIVKFKTAGTYTVDANQSGVNTIARPLEFELGAGLTKGDVVIAKSTRAVNAGQWVLPVTKAIFKEVIIHADTINSVLGREGGYYILKDCDVIDRNGVSGPKYSYGNVGADTASHIFAPTGSTPSIINWAAYECYFVAGCPGFFKLERNCYKEAAGEEWVIFDIRFSDVRVFNTTVIRQEKVFAQRMAPREAAATTLTVQSVAYADVVAGKTSIVATSDGNTLVATTGGDAEAAGRVFWDTGALAHTNTLLFRLNSDDVTARRILITGDYSASIRAGDTFWVVQPVHADVGQWNAISYSVADGGNTGNTVGENFYIQRKSVWCKNTAVDGNFQMLFLQPGPTSQSDITAVTLTTDGAGNGTLSSSGITLTPGDCIKVRSGAQIGEARFVNTVASATSFTLVSDFSAAQSAVNWRVAKTVKDALWIGCRWRYTDGSYQLNSSQLQNGHRHVGIVQCTHVDPSLNFRDAVAGVYGARNCAVWDCLINDVASDTGGAPGGFVFDGNWYISGSQYGTNAGGGAVTLSGSKAYPPGSFTHMMRGESISSGPMLPYSVDSVKLSTVAANNPVGAVTYAPTKRSMMGMMGGI